MIAAAYFGAHMLSPDWAVLSPAEQTVLAFTPEAPSAEDPKDGGAKAELLTDQNLFGHGASAMGNNAVDGPNGNAPKEAGTDKERGGLTLAVANGGRSIAVLDGKVVREGDRAGAMTIKRIERDRVLVFDKNLRWIHMEGKR